MRRQVGAGGKTGVEGAAEDFVIKGCGALSSRRVLNSTVMLKDEQTEA